MTPLDRLLLDSWPGRWQLKLYPELDEAVAVAQAIAKSLSPTEAIKELINSGQFETAEGLILSPSDPPIESQLVAELLKLLNSERKRARKALKNDLEQLQLRARRAGGDLHFDQDELLEMAELDTREVMRELEQQVNDLENQRRRVIRSRLETAPSLRDRVEACLQINEWEAAERRFDYGRAPVPMAVPSPADVPQPPNLDGRGAPIALAERLLTAPERLHEVHGWRVPDEETRSLLEALVAITPEPARILGALDILLGSSSYDISLDSARLTSTEILPIPRPRFVDPNGLVIALRAETASPNAIALNIGPTAAAGPGLGLRELLQVALAEGDRRIALLRVLGRQLPGELSLSALDDNTDLESAFGWALDLAVGQVSAPLLDILLAAASGRPSLEKILFTAIVSLPDRPTLLSENDLRKALHDPSTQQALEKALLADLDGDEIAVDILAAVDELGELTAASDDVAAVVAETQTMLELLREAEGSGPAPSADRVAAAVATLWDRGYGYTRDNGSAALRLGTIRALDK